VQGDRPFFSPTSLFSPSLCTSLSYNGVLRREDRGMASGCNGIHRERHRDVITIFAPLSLSLSPSLSFSALAVFPCFAQWKNAVILCRRARERGREEGERRDEERGKRLTCVCVAVIFSFRLCLCAYVSVLMSLLLLLLPSELCCVYVCCGV
jgi:hypothetical protein